MHQNVINAALALSTTVRFLEEGELTYFMKYIDFVQKKFAAGEIKDADDMTVAIDEFVTMLIDNNEI